MSESDLVVVQSYATEGEVEVAKGVLESSGIDAMIQADTAGRMREHLAWSGLGHRGLVREEDAAVARSLIALPENNDLVLLQRATEIQAEILQGALLSVNFRPACLKTTPAVVRASALLERESAVGPIRDFDGDGPKRGQLFVQWAIGFVRVREPKRGGRDG